VTAAGVPPLPDGAATVSIPGARVSMAETLIGGACQPHEPVINVSCFGWGHDP